MSSQSFQFSILIHYSEIGLKKNNRGYFERQFIQNISKHLKNLKHKKIRLVSARVLVENVDPNDWNLFRERLSNVMGLSSAILMIETKNDLSEMKVAIDHLITEKTFDSFRVTTKRHYKEFAQTSIEVNVELGAYIQDKTKKKVKLSNADLNIIIEILKDKTYVGCNRVVGFSGLPSGSDCGNRALHQFPPSLLQQLCAGFRSLC